MKKMYFSRRKCHDTAVKLSAVQPSDGAMGIVSGCVLNEAIWIGGGLASPIGRVGFGRVTLFHSAACRCCKMRRSLQPGVRNLSIPAIL